MSYEEVSRPKAKARRRGSKFRPERIRGARDETCKRIAAIIGVGVGTVKVTCSRLGISLRRPRVKLLPPRTTGAARTVAAGEVATFTISMKYKGQERNTELPLTPNMISQLALEASFRDQGIGELAKDLVESVMKNGLFREVLGE